MFLRVFLITSFFSAKKEELASDLLQAFPDIKENFDIIKKVGEGTADILANTKDRKFN